MEPLRRVAVPAGSTLPPSTTAWLRSKAGRRLRIGSQGSAVKSYANVPRITVFGREPAAGTQGILSAGSSGRSGLPGLAQLTKLRFLLVAPFRQSALKGREMTAQGEALGTEAQQP